MKHFFKFSYSLKKKKQKGQSLLEFVLLFVLIVVWGLLLIQESNKMIANYWESLITIIVNDSSQNTTIE